MDKFMASDIIEVDKKISYILNYIINERYVPHAILIILNKEIEQLTDIKIQLYDASTRQSEPDSAEDPQFISYISKIL
jgi:hypothetical protein